MEVYIGKMGRYFGVRKDEYRNEGEKILNIQEVYEIYLQIVFVNKSYKLVIIDYVCQNNYVMDWEGSKIVD